MEAWLITRLVIKISNKVGLITITPAKISRLFKKHRSIADNLKFFIRLNLAYKCLARSDVQIVKTKHCE